MNHLNLEDDIKTFGHPSYLSNLISSGVHSFNTQNSENLVTYHCRTDTFKYLFFFGTILELKKFWSFFLPCIHYNNILSTLLNELKSLHENIIILLDTTLTNLILYGNPQFNIKQNTFILSALMKYILESNRFDGSLF